MDFLDALWFPGPDGRTFGVVKARDTTTNEVKYYVGGAPGGNHNTEEHDARYIIAWGTKLSPERRKNLIAWLSEGSK